MSPPLNAPRPTEAVFAPWTVPQVKTIITWMRRLPTRVPQCPRHDAHKPKLVVCFEGFACEAPGCTFVQTWVVPDAFRCDPLEETRDEMQARVDKWNAKNPDGTPVDYDRGDPEHRVKKMYTRSRAYIHPHLGPSVFLYKVDGPVPLKHVEPRTQRKYKSVEQECMRVGD